MKTDDPPKEITNDEMNQLNVGPNLTQEQRGILGNVLMKYRKIFVFSPRELGHTKITQDMINMGMSHLSMFQLGE